MPKTFFAGVLSVLAIGTAVSTVFAGQEPKTPQDLVGRDAPSVKLKTLEDGDFDLATHKGKEYVVLDFWATWCPWCRESTEGFLELKKQYESRGVRFYIVSVGEEAETVRGYAKRHDVKAPFVLDADGKLASEYAVNYIPHVVLIDKEGKVKMVAAGGDVVHKDLRGELQRLFPDKESVTPEV